MRLSSQVVVCLVGIVANLVLSRSGASKCSSTNLAHLGAIFRPGHIVLAHGNRGAADTVQFLLLGIIPPLHSLRNLNYFPES